MDLGVSALYETPEQRLARLLLASAQGSAPPIDEPAEAQAAREAAAMRMRQAAQPEGGRQEGAMSAALSDPALLFNLSPLGMARDSMRAANEGDYGQAAMSAAPLVAPMAGPAVRAVGGAMQAFPKASALATGLAGMLSSSEAAPKLTREQQRQLEMETSRARNAAELDQQKRAQEAEIARQGAAQQVELERARREGDLATQQAAAQADTERQRAEAEYQQQEAVRQSQLPFRERYPGLANALPFAGVGAAAASPYAVRLGKALFNNAGVRQMEGAVGRGETALAGADKGAITRSLGELKSIQKSGAAAPEGPVSAGPGTLALSAGLPAEAALLPAEYDLQMLPTDNPNREAAKKMLTDPTELAKRVIPGLLQGIPAATLGNKVPAVWPEKLPPISNMEGLIAALRAAKPKRSKPQASSGSE